MQKSFRDIFPAPISIGADVGAASTQSSQAGSSTSVDCNGIGQPRTTMEVLPPKRKAVKQACTPCRKKRAKVSRCAVGCNAWLISIDNQEFVMRSDFTASIHLASIVILKHARPLTLNLLSATTKLHARGA